MNQGVTSKAATYRHEFYKANYGNLVDKAYRAINELKIEPSEAAVVAIDVDDPDWSDLANQLMPGEDWQATRDAGMRPVARGSVTWEVVEYIKAVAPSIAEGIEGPPKEGHLYAFIMAAGGVSVYEVPYGMPHTTKGSA